MHYKIKTDEVSLQSKAMLCQRNNHGADKQTLLLVSNVLVQEDLNKKYQISEEWISDHEAGRETKLNQKRIQDWQKYTRTHISEKKLLSK